MRPDAIARRYAKALFDIADTAGGLDHVAFALTRLAALLDDPDAARVLTGPLARDPKRALLIQLADEAGGSEAVRNFLLLLDEHDRLAHLPAIRAVFDELVDRRRGITRARVRTAAPLSNDAVGELTQALGAVIGKRVLADVEEDPALIAGLVVDVEGRVYDGSLRTQLRKLHRQMAAGS
jgi:F-type H+-transporting ATPase subunit delta